MQIQEITEVVPDIIRVDRRFDLSADELWEWVTQPHLTEKWFGYWQKTGETSEEIEIVMNREEGSPVQTAIILECNEKRGYTLAMGGSDTELPWHILIQVSEGEPSGSNFTLIQPWEQEELRRDLQAGWEYYANCLKAAVAGTPYPEFSDYLAMN